MLVTIKVFVFLVSVLVFGVFSVGAVIRDASRSPLLQSNQQGVEELQSLRNGSEVDDINGSCSVGVAGFIIT